MKIVSKKIKVFQFFEIKLHLVSLHTYIQRKLGVKSSNLSDFRFDFNDIPTGYVCEILTNLNYTV